MQQIKDEKLLKNLTSTDFVALGSKYHKLYYTHFITHERTANRSLIKEYLNRKEMPYGTVISELI